MMNNNAIIIVLRFLIVFSSFCNLIAVVNAYFDPVCGTFGDLPLEKPLLNTFSNQSSSLCPSGLEYSFSVAQLYIPPETPWKFSSICLGLSNEGSQRVNVEISMRSVKSDLPSSGTPLVSHKSAILTEEGSNVYSIDIYDNDFVLDTPSSFLQIDITSCSPVSITGSSTSSRKRYASGEIDTLVKLSSNSEWTTQRANGFRVLAVSVEGDFSTAYPTGWHCPHSSYYDNVTCDCGCGARDPDCNNAYISSFTCVSNEVCSTTTFTCITSGWASSKCAPKNYGTGDGCQCCPGLVDPDCELSSQTKMCGAYPMSSTTCGADGSCTGCGDGVVQSPEECDSTAHCTSCKCDSGYTSIDGTCTLGSAVAPSKDNTGAIAGGVIGGFGGGIVAVALVGGAIFMVVKHKNDKKQDQMFIDMLDMKPKAGAGATAVAGSKGVSNAGPVKIPIKPGIIAAVDVTTGDKIGDGPFGAQYRGKLRGNDVAVKRIKLHLTDAEMAQFAEEAQALYKLRGPLLAVFYGVIAEPGALAVIFEYSPQGTLRTVFSKYRQLSNFARVKIASEIAMGISFLHQQNVIHKNLKPENVVVIALDGDKDIQIKLTEYGTMAIGTERARELSATKGIDTVAYVAPEVLSKREPSDHSDSYSFGVIVWELWAQKKPYSDGSFASASAVFDYVLSGKRLAIPVTCPQQAGQIITKCCTPVPSQRMNFDSIIESLGKVPTAIVAGPRSGSPSATSNSKNSSSGSQSGSDVSGSGSGSGGKSGSGSVSGSYTHETGSKHSGSATGSKRSRSGTGSQRSGSGSGSGSGSQHSGSGTGSGSSSNSGSGSGSQSGSHSGTNASESVSNTGSAKSGSQHSDVIPPIPSMKGK